jgi:hypothetical protein
MFCSPDDKPPNHVLTRDRESNHDLEDQVAFDQSKTNT